MSKASGMDYAPEGKAAQVVEPGQFVFAAVMQNQPQGQNKNH